MSQSMIFLIAALIVTAIYVSVSESRRRRQKMIQKIRDSWGRASERNITDEELDIISHYYQDCVNGDIPCDESDYIDDITWNDLSMNTVYKRMNTCFSSVGQEYLYKMLRLPFNDRDKLDEADRLAAHFDSNKKDRENIQQIFYKLGFAKKISVSDYVGLLMDLKPQSNIIHYLSMLFIIVSFVIAFGYNATLGIILVVASVAFAIISYYSYKAKAEPFFICIINIVKMTQAVKDIDKLNISTLDSYNESIKNITQKMSKATSGAGMLASSNENGSIAEMLLDYLRMITHIDLIKFNTMLHSINEHTDDIYEMIRLLGFIESTIAIASYRAGLNYWSRPEFISGRNSIALEDAYHPCIDNPVANSITLSRNVLLTGSNASGKSTFLKTVAINAILSQSICTSPARSYRAPVFRIYSSMALKDNLEGHDSYYIVEIKSLKRILDSIDDKKKPVLCFVDEVLRGTNTVERIAASSQILKSMNGKNVICFAATHDIELTKILKDCYDNYHFQEDFCEDVVFNYKLMDGPATSRNAIKLLKGIGYDDSITKAADDMANRFLQTGDWC